MAKDKKSFIAYCDWIESFEELSDEEAGRLAKHLFRYVNDKNPEAPDKLTKMCFIPIKQALKRDLNKYETIRERNIENGKKGGRPKKPTGLSGLNEKPKKAVNDNVSVNVNVNDIDNKKEKKKVFNFRKSLIDLGVDEQVAEDWMKVRKTKKATNTETSFKRIKNHIIKSGRDPNECISLAVAKDWKGFEASWMDNELKKQNNGISKNEQRLNALKEDW